MGIRDREYMKRPSDHDGGQAPPPDSRLEAFFSGFLQRHPRFFVYFGICLVVLIVITILVAKFSANGQ
jgi:hypothetical protein